MARCLKASPMNHKVNDMTHAHTNRLRMLAASLFLVCCASATWGQTTPATSEEKPEVDLLLKEKWRHVGFHLISDVPGDNLESVLDEPSYGFALTYMKHDRKGIFDGGFDLGFQPIGGFDTNIMVTDNE
ncbi:MAG TPA: hypothetical protein DEA66_06520, partial [Flavobacteriales bacterium]|nr:hypothetical protein [Flavobacteriales bacterium]